MPDDSTLAVIENEKYSVREFFPGTYGGLVGDGIGILYGGGPDLLAPWGTYQCDVELRAYHYMLHNQLWSGAHDIWSQKVLSTPYEISGGRNLTFQWQDIFMESEFAMGYDEMLAPGITDYLTLNRGMFLEIVSYGDPDTELKPGARVLGINHLDALRIMFTGNLDYPFVYYSEQTHTAHRMHRSRVIHMTHSPSPNTRMFAMGRSPLYAALSSANAQILLGRHQNEMLSDMPPPGLIIFTNVKGEDVRNAMVMFEQQRRKEGQNVYRAPMQIEGKDPAQPVTVTFTPLAQVPEGFDRTKYMEVDVNLMALNLQLDPQDIWPLANAGLNGGQQSKELAAKTEVKGSGYFMTRLERKWNMITPRPLEFKYKAQNSQQSKANADVAGVWVNQVIVPAVKEGVFTLDEARLFAANNVESFADVLLDEDGNVVRLPDDDPKDIGAQQLADLLAAQGTPAIPAQPAHITENITPGQTPANSPVNDGEQTATDNVQLGKDYNATKSAFTGDIAAIFADAQNGDIGKTVFKARVRSSINTYGKAAYLDGLEAGGVSASEYDSSDSESFATILASQSQYVSNVADQFYKTEDGFTGNVTGKADLWLSTLNEFYYGGVYSADKNGMYGFVGDDGKENCSTCKGLKGQVHRMKWYVDNRLRPGVDHDNFECGTWPGHCMHFLEKQLKKSFPQMRLT